MCTEWSERTWLISRLRRTSQKLTIETLETVESEPVKDVCAKETVMQEYLSQLLKARETKLVRELELKRIEEAYDHIKDSNRERIQRLEEENKSIDSEISGKRSAIKNAIQEQESRAYKIRAPLIQEVSLCAVKNALQGKEAGTEEGTEILFQNWFMKLYEAYHLDNGKKVNKVSYEIAKKSKIDFEVEGMYLLEELIGFEFRERSYHSALFSRDFKTEQDARKFADKNREGIIAQTIERIVAFEKEYAKCTLDIDSLFDFRLVTEDWLADTGTNYFSFQVGERNKHILILKKQAKKRAYYDEDKEEYDIKIEQHGFKLKFSGHRHSYEAEKVTEYLRRYFKLPVLEFEESEPVA